MMADAKLIRIKSRGQQRLVTESDFKRKWRGLGFEVVKDEAEEKSDKKLTPKQKLQAKATELGIEFTEETTSKDLEAKIKEAEEAKNKE